MKNLIRMCLAGVMVLAACMVVSAKEKDAELKGNWPGTLAAAPADAAANVVALFTAKYPKSFGTDKAVTLVTTNAAVAAEIKGWVAQAATVVVSGEKNSLKDPTSIAVRACHIPPPVGKPATSKDK